MESTQITAFGRAAGRHADHQLTHRLIAQWREADDAARDRIKSVIREIDPDMSVRPLLEAYEQGFEPAGDVLTELALTEAYCCVLAPYLRKSDRSRRLVILLLDTIGTAGCVKHLEYALYDCGEGIAWGPLIRCLQADGGGDAIDQLVEMYRNAGDGQAAKALYELGWLPDEQAQLEGLLCDAGAWDDIIDRRLGGEPITDAAYQRAVSVTSSGQRWRKALSDMAKHPSAEFAPCFLGVLAGYDGRHYDLTPQGPRNIQDDLNRRDELLGVAYAWLRGAVAALPVETLRTFAEVRVVSRYKTYARPDDDQGEDDLRPGTTQAGRQDHGGRFRELAKAELGRRGESAAE